MKICPKCSSENKNDEKFCESCGVPIQDIKPKEEG
jgi:uncharacterized membrane protein YvbJ